MLPDLKRSIDDLKRHLNSTVLAAKTPLNSRSAVSFGFLFHKSNRLKIVLQYAK